MEASGSLRGYDTSNANVVQSASAVVAPVAATPAVSAPAAAPVASQSSLSKLQGYETTAAAFAQNASVNVASSSDLVANAVAASRALIS